MRHSIQGRIQRQVSFLREQFLQDGDLPFTDVLTADVVLQALTTIGTCWKDRIFTPLVTLWVFLGQVLKGCIKAEPVMRGKAVQKPAPPAIATVAQRSVDERSLVQRSLWIGYEE